MTTETKPDNKVELHGGPMDGSKRSSRKPELLFTSITSDGVVHSYQYNPTLGRYEWAGLRDVNPDEVVLNLKVGDRD